MPDFDEAPADSGAREADAFARWLDSRPEDDEPLTDAERTALVESSADIAAGHTTTGAPQEEPGQDKQALLRIPIDRDVHMNADV